MDDFDNFIRHSEFGRILELAGTLKDHKSQLVTIAHSQHDSRSSSTHSLTTRARKKKKFKPMETGPMEPQYGDQDFAQDVSVFDNNGREERPQSRKGNFQHSNSFDSAAKPNSFDSAAELIRATLIPLANEGSGAVGMMGRGECTSTDSLIDETIRSLADELKLCLDLKKELRQGVSHHGSQMPAMSYSSKADMYYDTTKQVNWAGADSQVKEEGIYRGDVFDEKVVSIANKFAKWQTDILTEWMIEHREHPFPSLDEIHGLAFATNLNDTQIVNWTTNVRKRNLKATVEREKKPHHFLDYLFLATDREKKMRAEHPDVDFSFLNNTTAPNSFWEKGGGRLAPAEPTAHSRGHGFSGVKPSRPTSSPIPILPPRTSQNGKLNSPAFLSSCRPASTVRGRPPVSSAMHQRKSERVKERVFRGKEIVDLKRNEHGQKEAEVPPHQATRAHQLQKERERTILQAYGEDITDISPESFDDNEGRLFMDDIDEDMFDGPCVTAGTNTGAHANWTRDGTHFALPNTVSLEEEKENGSDQRKVPLSPNQSTNGVPYDEDAEDYLMRLLAS